MREQEEIERIKQEVQNDVSSVKRKASEPVEEHKPIKKKKKKTAETLEGTEVRHEPDEDLEQNIAEEVVLESEQDKAHVPDAASDDLKSGKTAFKVPDKVDLSIDEAKALFKVRWD